MKILLLLALLSQRTPSEDSTVPIGSDYKSLRAYLDGISFIEDGQNLGLDSKPKDCSSDDIAELKELMLRNYLTMSYLQHPLNKSDKRAFLLVSRHRLQCMAQLSEMVLAHRLRHQQSSVEYFFKLHEAVLAYLESHPKSQSSDPLYSQASKVYYRLRNELAAQKK